MVPSDNFSALTHACVELLANVDPCHKALGPKATEVVVVIFVPMRKRVISNILLEFDGSPETTRNVAFAM
jgi:hypothetical protein